MSLPKPILTEFGIHHRLESCAVVLILALMFKCYVAVGFQIILYLILSTWDDLYLWLFFLLCFQIMKPRLRISSKDPGISRMAPTTVAALVLSLLAGLANSQGAELFECPRGKTKKTLLFTKIRKKIINSLRVFSWNGIICQPSILFQGRK